MSGFYLKIHSIQLEPFKSVRQGEVEAVGPRDRNFYRIIFNVNLAVLCRTVRSQLTYTHLKHVTTNEERSKQATVAVDSFSP